MFERVDHQLGDDKAQADGLVGVHQTFVGLDRDGQPGGIGNHRGRKAFAKLCKIYAQRDVVRVRTGQVALYGGDRHDPLMGVLEVPAHFFRLHFSRALHQNAGDDLQAVGDAMLNLAQQHGFLADEFVFQRSFRTGLGDVGEGDEEPNGLGVAVNQPCER